MKKWFMVYDIEWEEEEDWLPTSQVVTIEDTDVSDIMNLSEIEEFIEEGLEFETGCHISNFRYEEFDC